MNKSMEQQTEKTAFTGCTHETSKTEEICSECKQPINGEKTCDRCGDKTEVSLHYWAPPELYDDFIMWPKSWFCARCKALWERHMMPKVEKPAGKIFKKQDVRKSMKSYGSFEILWLDVPDVEAFENAKLEEFLVCCQNDFIFPAHAYKADGWKVIGYYQSGDMVRMFALRPRDEKKVQQEGLAF
jgi:hypothetical protein